jgi:transcriptional regulator with XRE-family HTH domain
VVLGDRLVGLRERKGLSQSEVAKAVHLTQQGIDNYEKGRREPKGPILVKLAQFYDVTSDYLLGLTDDPQGVARATHPDEQAGDDLVVMFRGKRQKLTPEYQRMLVKLMEAAAEEEAEKAKKSQP